VNCGRLPSRKGSRYWPKRNGSFDATTKRKRNTGKQSPTMNDVDQDRICNKLAAVIVPITTTVETEKEENMIKEETEQENNETAATVSMAQQV
jgi:hypothetical protein